MITRVKGLTLGRDLRDAHFLQNFPKLLGDQLHPFFIFLVGAGLLQSKVQIVQHRQQQSRRHSLSVAKNALPLLLRALAVIIIFGQRPQIFVV